MPSNSSIAVARRNNRAWPTNSYWPDSKFFVNTAWRRRKNEMFSNKIHQMIRDLYDALSDNLSHFDIALSGIMIVTQFQAFKVRHVIYTNVKRTTVTCYECFVMADEKTVERMRTVPGDNPCDQEWYCRSTKKMKDRIIWANKWIAETYACMKIEEAASQ